MATATIAFFGRWASSLDRIKHANGNQDHGGRQMGCTTWWRHAGSEVCATPISDGDDDGAAQAEAARSETAAVCDQDEAHGGDAAAAAAGPPSELDRLRREKEVTEDQMQAAVDNDDFDEASRLQEIIDELGDRIEALGG